MSRTRVLTVLATLTAMAGVPRFAGAIENDAAGLFAKLDANGDGHVSANEVGDEHQLLFKRLLRVGDEDGDRQLTDAEFAAAIEPIRAEKGTVEKQGSRLPGADAMVVLMAKMDANGDQQLDGEEIPGDCRRAFEQMLTAADGDKNGRLDRKEIAIGAPRLSIVARLATARMGLDLDAEMNELPAETMESIERMDAYQRPEAEVDPAAVKQMARQLLRQFDENGDGKLSAREAPPRLRQRFDQADVDGDKRLDRNELQGVAERMVRLQSFAENRKKIGPSATEPDPSPKRDQQANRTKNKPRKKGLK